MSGDPRIELASGMTFPLLNPSPADIKIKDIAHSLALQCRYNGHCRRFFSVAEHSVLCADLARDKGFPLALQRLVFLHDAAEAYVGDVTGPLKDLLPRFKPIERRIQTAIRCAFGLSYPIESDATLIKQIDIIMLASESRHLMFSCGRDWDLPEQSDSHIPIECWAPPKAEQYFLAKFTILFPESEIT